MVDYCSEGYFCQMTMQQMLPYWSYAILVCEFGFLVDGGHQNPQWSCVISQVQAVVLIVALGQKRERQQQVS
jgi:hypothetical protein